MGGKDVGKAMLGAHAHRRQDDEQQENGLALDYRHGAKIRTYRPGMGHRA